jgi:hypothetical protein
MAVFICRQKHLPASTYLLTLSYSKNKVKKIQSETTRDEPWGGNAKWK